jgi:trans-aconitate methyltransferase
MTEWNADGYQQISGLQAALADEQLTRIKLGAQDRILDVGCGNGKITAEMATRIPQGSVLGVDASQNMITFAQEHYGFPIQPNLRFEVADVRHLPYTHEFDQITSFNMLHWVPEQEAALRSIHAALKPDGKAFLRFVPEGDRQCIEDVIEATCQLPQWRDAFQTHQKPYVHFTPDAYCALAEQAGFRVLQVHVDDQSWDFKSREAFAAYCRVTLAEWTRFLPESKWTAFITDVLNAYQSVAADTPAELNMFKFYQMEIVLTPA